MRQTSWLPRSGRMNLARSFKAWYSAPKQRRVASATDEPSDNSLFANAPGRSISARYPALKGVAKVIVPRTRPARTASTFGFGLVLLALIMPAAVFAQTTSFTYQGRLTEGGMAANGNYDLQFALFDSASGGAQIGATQTVNMVVVSGGIFAVTLDFGVNAFPGANRFLEIGVRSPSGGSFTTLSPRQQISSTPYAIHTLSATTADALSSACAGCVQDSQISSVAGSKVTGVVSNAANATNATNATTATTATNATQLGGVAASQYVQTNDSRLTDARPPTPGSSNYIQNNPASTQSGSFNISGNGTTGGTLNGNIVNATTQFNIGGNRVLSVPATSNLFAGLNAGFANSSGANNSFVGSGAGQLNTVGARNAFFGFNAGHANAGDALGNGSDNAFFGSGAGVSNTGQQNSFFGTGSGAANTTGNFNSFFGQASGLSNTTGGFNTFIGSNTTITPGPIVNGVATTGSNNTAIGFGAKIDLASGTNLTNATAIGANAMVAHSNSLVLGSINGVNNATADTLVGIGTTSPSSKLQVQGINDSQTCNVVTIVYGNPGLLPGCGDALGIATSDPTSKLIDGIGQFGTVFNVRGDGEINTLGALSVGTLSPVRTLTVNGRARIGSIPLEASVASVCFNFAGDLLQCGGSSLRFKTKVHPFFGGLDIIRRLRPISFNWKESGMPDIGLGAEDVAKVAPSFAITDSKGEIAGVKYDRLNILLINAVKEQQQQIEQQQKQIATLLTSNTALNARLRGVEKSLRKKAGSARRRR